MYRYPVLSFSSGELSPQIDARSDVDKYRSGCRTLENMIPRIYGPAARRSGTKYIETCNGVSRVIPFIYSSTIAYIVLMENQRFWFYYDGGRVLDTWGRRLGIDTIYLAADLFELQYKQSNDVMWITHNSYAQRKLSRTSANSFSLDEITFTNGPFMKRNDLRTADGITLTPSVTTGSGTLTASSALFDVGHVGALFSIIQPRVNTTVDGTMTSPATGVIGSAILVEGAFTFTTHGTWTGTVRLERSIDSGSTWEKYREWTSENADAQVQYTANEEEDNVQYRINVTAMSANTGAYASVTSKIRATLTVNSSTQEGICEVIGYTSSTSVSMTVLKDFASTNADIRWSEGCWSTYRGFPKCVTFFENRCVYAATTFQPQTVWFSATDDFEDFKECTKDDSAFSLTMSSDTRNAIQWLAAADSILVGTTGSEWRIWAEDGSLTPSNFQFKPQTERGSKDLQALVCGDAVLFVDFVGRKVRELTFDGADKYKYVSPDLTALAEHITDSGITSMAFQRNPDPILWCTRTNGTLISMTYEREQTVIGWARHPFKAGPGTSGVLTGGQGEYPTLQELTAAEIPDAPAEPLVTPADTSVSNATDLQNMSGSNKYYLTTDIDLTGVTWTPVPNFGGILDGRNFTISNLSFTGVYGATKKGLFANLLAGAQIYDLNFSNCTVTVANGDMIGILSGYSNYRAGDIILKNITLTNCTVSGALHVGTLIGYMEQTYSTIIYDCHAINPSVLGGSARGGLIGLFHSNPNNSTEKSYIINCSTQGGTIGPGLGGQRGGLIGEVQTYYGRVTPLPLPTASHYLGGAIYNSYSTATISSTTVGTSHNMGGLIGKLSGYELISCYSTGDITVTSTTTTSVGGLVGWCYYYANFINCYATGNLTFSVDNASKVIGRVGGFVGSITSPYGIQITRCYSTGNISIIDDLSLWYQIGGFIGVIYSAYKPLYYDNDVLIERSWSTGDITIDNGSKAYVGFFGGAGGFIGGLNTGDITFDSDDTVQTITFQNCYAWGSITYNDDANDVATGGFLGVHSVSDTYEETYVTDYIWINCYVAQTDNSAGSNYTGQLLPGSRTNGFIGHKIYDFTEVSVLTSYWDTDTSTITNDQYAIGHTTSWMQTKTNYEDAGWDFDTLWQLTTTVYDYTASGLGPNSVAVIPGSTEDEVWLIVYRVINDQEVRYLEQMQPRDWGDDQEDQWFVDSGLALETADADGIVSGLDHLEGEEVAALVDGAIVARQTVSAGSINVGKAIAAKAVVGLPFRYKLQTMRFDIDAGATTKGSLKRFAEVVISFFKTGNAKYGRDVDNLFEIDWRTTEAFGSPPALYTGDKVVAHEGGFTTEDEFIITSDEPVSCTVRAVVPRIEASGR